MKEFIKEYGTEGASIILRQAAIRIRNPKIGGVSNSTIECAELVEEIATALELGLESSPPPTVPEIAQEIPPPGAHPILPCNSLPHEYFFKPDWCQLWTGERSEDELKDFKFEGPGWYIYPNVKDGTVDSILVLATNNPDLFRFNVYNNRDARKAFKMVCELPTHREP